MAGSGPPPQLHGLQRGQEILSEHVRKVEELRRDLGKLQESYPFGACSLIAVTYGPANVTAKAQQFVTPEGITLKHPLNKVFGDTWSHVKKSLTVVYTDKQGAVKVFACKESDGSGHIHIQF